MLFSVGCTSMATIDQRFMDVVYADGISAVEAKSIAQRFLLSHPKVENYAVTNPQVDSQTFSSFPQWKGKAWVVCFTGKSINLFNPNHKDGFIVAIDKRTGRILFYQYGPRLIPTELKNFGEEGILVE